MRKRSILICALTALMCLGSLFLPGLVLSLRDRALARASESIAVDEVELNLITKLDMVGKLRLAGDASAAVIPLESGRLITGKDAVQQAIKTQHEMGIYLGDGISSSVSPRLLISDQGESMVLWDVILTWPDSGLTGHYLIDDETSCLLGIELKLDSAAVDSEYGDMEVEGDDADYHYFLWLFLGPLGLDESNVAAIYFTHDSNTGYVLVTSDSAEADLPIVLRLSDPVDWCFSINMPTESEAASDPVIPDTTALQR